MFSFLGTLQKVFGVIPAAVTTAETMGKLLSPGQKTGPAKLQGVSDAVKMALGIVESVDPALGLDVTALDAGITMVINGVIAIKNAHKPATAAPAAG